MFQVEYRFLAVCCSGRVYYCEFFYVISHCVVFAYTLELQFAVNIVTLMFSKAEKTSPKKQKKIETPSEEDAENDDSGNDNDNEIRESEQEDDSSQSGEDNDLMEDIEEGDEAVQEETTDVQPMEEQKCKFKLCKLLYLLDYNMGFSLSI